MAWRCQGTSASVDVTLWELFSNEQLLQGLLDAKWITEAEAEAIMLRAKQRAFEKKVLEDATGLKAEEYAEARHALGAGRLSDARIHLERFLGREWTGVLAHG